MLILAIRMAYQFQLSVNEGWSESSVTYANKSVIATHICSWMILYQTFLKVHGQGLVKLKPNDSFWVKLKFLVQLFL